MKSICSAFLFLFSFVVSAQTVNEVNEPEEWVNPLMGTQSKFSLSNGNTYPAIALPWGMNFWSPQTGKMGDGWLYTYDAEKIRGFKQTHQPSPWINDYGQFSIMPVTGKLRFTENERGSWFSHKSEVVKPFYYSVYLADHDATFEIAPTERAASVRITFPETDSAFVVLDAFDKGSFVKIIPEENKIIGFTTKNSGGVPENFKNFFVIVFDRPFQFKSVWNEKELVSGTLELNASHVGAVVGFKTRKGDKVNLSIASSFISFEQAEINLKEIGSDTFETVKQ
jgi:predicted alpha-1,2-mannosidase